MAIFCSTILALPDVFLFYYAALPLRRISLFTIMSLCAATSLAAERTANYLSLPLRPFNAAVGGQVTHNIPVQAATAVNPAMLAYGSQNAFFAGGIFGSNLTGFFADTALFSPFGGLGLGVDYLQADDKSAALNFSYGGFLSKRVATGLSLSPRYTTFDSRQAFGFGINPSLLIDSKWHTAFGDNDGFGIYSPSVFLTTQNLAIPVGESELLAKPAAHVGIITGFYQSTNFNWATIVSTYGSDRFDRVPILVGIQTQYRWFLLSAGYGTSNYSATGNGLSLGLGAHVPFSFGDSFLFYNLSVGNSTRSDIHSVTAGVRLGGIDSDPPEVSFESEGKSFSPDNDGVRDIITFTAKVTDKSPIVYYEFRIRDAKGNIVHKQKGDERIREKDFSFTLFFRSFMAPRGRSDIPERFSWNGRITAQKKKPVKDTVFEEEASTESLPDGVYNYEFWAMDEKNNESRHVTGEIAIDTKRPGASVEISDDLISPNGDGQRDLLTITQDTTASDSYEGVVLNTAGEKIRSFQWPENAPTRVDFDGKRDNGEPAEEGVYRYRLTGRDAAGNRSEALSANFYISRRIDALFLKSSAMGFNPAQKAFSELELFPSVAFADGYIDGEILIRKACSPKAEDIIFKIPVLDLKPNEKKKKTKKDKSLAFVWRGEAASANRAPDGTYCLAFRGRYENGNSPESPPIKILLDSTPPELEIQADLNVRQFTPDGDGENEEQAFRLSAADLSQIKSYTLAIDEVVPESKGVKLIPVRRFQGEGEIPLTVFWDGRSDTGAAVESLTLYQYTLTATDALGNTTTTAPRRFETGILAPASGSGFQIRLPNADIENPGDERLSLLYNLLSRYPKYKIKIEVHSAPGAGIERSLKLTEAAARKVYDYLVDKGISAERIAYQGFGDSSPVYNARGAMAQKNRRIDVFLSR